MATVTPGYIFQNNEVVTPTKINSAALPTVAVDDDEITTAKILNTAITTAKIADANVTTAKIADGAVTQEKLNSSVTLVPTGAVMPFAMNSAPSGWLQANGAAVSRSTYAALFSAIGTTYGAGNGSSTFNLPDLRGYFVRGAGTNADGTASAAFGAKQADALKSHTHTTSGAIVDFPGFGGNIASASFSLTPRSQPLTSGGPSTGAASETRPANIALLYCIKF
jgi:microcystin-dependent protein